MQMAAHSFRDSRSLHLKFMVESHGEFLPNDFIGLFECIDIFSRTIIEHEAFSLFSDVGFSDQWRLNTLQRIHRLGKKVPVPVDILEVHKGSWHVETLLQGAAVIWFLRSYVHPVVQEAWNDSRLREMIITFLRNKIFLGAKKKLESKAIEASNFRGLRVVEIEGPEVAIEEETEIKIKLKKTQIIEPQLTDQELLEDFIIRLRR